MSFHSIPELCHDCIDVGVASSGFSPGFQLFRVAVPVNLATHLVTLDYIVSVASTVILGAYIVSLDTIG